MPKSKNEQIVVEIDREANAAYIQLSKQPVAKTKEVNDLVFIDLDGMDVAVGIEILGLGTTIPIEQIQRDYHIHSDVAALIEQLRPSIEQTWTVSVTTDAVSTRNNRALTPC